MRQYRCETPQHNGLTVGGNLAMLDLPMFLRDRSVAQERDGACGRAFFLYSGWRQLGSWLRAGEL